MADMPITGMWELVDLEYVLTVGLLTVVSFRRGSRSTYATSKERG